MAVHCPACGNLSQDPEFCDHCNADLNPPPAHRPPTVCPLSDQAIELSEDQRQRLARPDGCVLLRTAQGWRRVHWLPRELDSVWRTPLQHRLALESWVLPPGRLLEQDNGAWAIFEATCDWVVSWTMPAADPMEDLDRLLVYLSLLTEALDELHRLQTVWLTFDPVEIERAAQGRFRITNLDLRLFPFQQCPDQLAVKASYAAPEITRFHPNDVGPRTDVFHTALVAYYWLARLMPDGVPGRGLDAFQFELPPLRVYQPALPEGIEAVVRQGLALEAGQRFTSPGGFVAALAEAVERARRRRAWTGAVRWELGLTTRAGRTKTALQKGNEDQVLVREYAEPKRALVAVADGISTCDVGSGQLASLITTIVLDNAFDGQAGAADFPAKITHLCRHGTQTLLDWAMEKGYTDQLVQGSDLMGTTLTAGWLEGRELLLANLGDSRGYLIDGPLVEQLTVDGDLGSYLLAHGAPPEHLQELGLMSRALRECIGGCTVTPSGRVEVLDDSCIPSITRWPLLPGDILVLCSDGLVEPGAFLDDANLGDLVQAHKERSAQDLAELLVEAADALQRLPSFLEPEGFGDNISCIVIKIVEA
jgi:protein phosphatase